MYFGDLLYDYGLQTKVDPSPNFVITLKTRVFLASVDLVEVTFLQAWNVVLLKYELGIRKCDIFESLGEIKCKHIICGVCWTCALF